MHEQQDLGAEAVAFRDTFFDKNGNVYGWMKGYLLPRYRIDSLTSLAGKAAQNQVRSAVRYAQGWKEREKGRQGKRPLLWEKRAAPELLERKRGGGRGRRCPIIGEE